MEQKKDTEKMVMKLVEKVALKSSEKAVNRNCPMWFYQEKEPRAVRKLRKF